MRKLSKKKKGPQRSPSAVRDDIMIDVLGDDAQGADKYSPEISFQPLTNFYLVLGPTIPNIHGRGHARKLEIKVNATSAARERLTEIYRLATLKLAHQMFFEIPGWIFSKIAINSV